MSLAQVQLSLSDFSLIHEHIASKPRYRNMHLREACQRNGERDLRYLHAMHAAQDRRDIEGMIAGPGVFWHYKLTPTRFATQVSVLVDRGAPRDRARIGRRFLKEILTRIQQEREREQEGSEYFPTRTPGQFYLRRRAPGMPSTHPNCRVAVTARVLDPQFVANFAAWNLELLHR